MSKRTVTYYVDVDSKGSVIGWRKAEDAETDFRKGNKKTQKSLEGLIKKYGSTAAASAIFYTTLRRTIERGKEFENKLADLEAITGITGDRLQRLGSRSIELSKIYGTSAANIIEANKLVASQLAQKIDFGTEEGFQELQKVSEQAIVLSKAAGITLQDSVATTASIINQFNLSIEESDRVINTLAAGSKFGAAEVPAIGSALVNAGSAAAGANASIEETNALIQVLAANGQVGERAGTALRAIFLRLQTAGEDLAEYGLENIDIKANGVNATLKQLNPILDDAAALKKIFGEEAFNAASILIREADAVAEMTEKVTGSNTAYQQAETRMNTFEGATDRLQATIDGALIPAFQESNGVMVKLINNVASLIEQFSGGIGVINQWLDTHSKLRSELDLGESSTDSQVRSMRDLRNELANAAMEGKLTADQQKELREAYEGTTEHLKKRASALFDDTFALKQQRDALEENLEKLKETETSSFGPGAAAKAVAVKKLTKRLEGLNLEIASNETRFEQYMTAIDEGTMTFDEFIEKVREAQEAQAESNTENSGTSGTKEQIEDLRSLAGLQQAYAQEKKQFEQATDQQARDNHNARMKELQSQIQAIQDRYKSEKTNLDSIAGVKSAISEREQAYLNATSEAEREKHAQAMTELQQMLEAMNIRQSNEIEGLFSIKSVKDAIRAEEQAYIEAKTEADRERHLEEILRLQGILDEKRKGWDEQRKTEKKQQKERIGNLTDLENYTKSVFNQITASGETSYKNIAKAAYNSARDQIASEISIGVAAAVRSALQNVPFPLNIIAASGAAALAAGVFNRVVPKFEDGGLIKGKRHREGGTIIEAEDGEFVTNRESTRLNYRWLKLSNENPQLFNKLMMNLKGFNLGGLVGIPKPDLYNLPSPADFRVDIPNQQNESVAAISEAVREGFDESARNFVFVQKGRDLEASQEEQREFRSSQVVQFND